jgi:hypothetical protein
VRRLVFHPSAFADWVSRGLPTPAAAYAALSSGEDVPIAVSHPKLREALKTLPQVN